MKKFYEFSQNNSGGSFHVDGRLCHRVFIEANSQDEADEIAESIGIYFDGVEKGIDCSCCGDRWNRSSLYDVVDLKKLSKEYKQNFSSIEEYVQMLSDEYGWTIPDARIFYANGKVVEIFKK